MSCMSRAPVKNKPRRSGRHRKNLSCGSRRFASGCWLSAQRTSPRRDDKIVTGWNGLMIAAYADAYRLLKQSKYRQAAERAAGFLLAELRLPDGRLLRTYCQGRAKLPAYLEDYAFLTHGLLRLYRATGEARWLREARSLNDRLVADFDDSELGGFFFTAVGHERLLARAKDAFDNALPSGNSVAILNLLDLYRQSRQASYLEHAGKAATGLQHVAGTNSSSHAIGPDGPRRSISTPILRLARPRRSPVARPLSKRRVS